MEFDFGSLVYLLALLWPLLTRLLKARSDRAQQVNSETSSDTVVDAPAPGETSIYEQRVEHFPEFADSPRTTEVLDWADWGPAEAEEPAEGSPEEDWLERQAWMERLARAKAELALREQKNARTHHHVVRASSARRAHPIREVRHASPWALPAERRTKAKAQAVLRRAEVRDAVLLATAWEACTARRPLSSRSIRSR